MAHRPFAALALLAAATPAYAQMQTPSVTGAAPSFGQPQAEQNMSQQPGNSRQAGPSGGTPRSGDPAGATKPQGPVTGNSAPGQAQNQQVTQPSMPQGQSQMQQNQGNQPGNARQVAPAASVPTGAPAGATKPQGPVTGPASRAQAGQPASPGAK